MSQIQKSSIRRPRYLVVEIKKMVSSINILKKILKETD